MKRILCTIALMVAMFATLPLSTLIARAASSFASLPAGHAYAAYATPTVGSIVNSGVVFAPAGISCTSASTTSTGHVNNLTIGTNTTSGTADTSVTNTQTSTSGLVQSKVTVQNLNALGGLVKATELQATVSSTASASGVSSAVQQTSFSGLVVAGTPIPSTPAPNAVRSLAGIGTVTLNEQSLSNSSQSTRVAVNMVDIRITVANNSLHLPVDTQIVFGHVDSSELLEPQPTTVEASAYGAYVLNGNQVTAAPIAYASTSCTGGSNQKQLTTATIPTIGTTNAITDTVNTSISSSGTTASGQVNITGLNLLGGLVKADTVVAKANASFNGTGSGSASVTLTNATIAGTTQNQNPAPNTYVKIPGLGYAYINEQQHSFSATGAFQSVYAMDVYVTSSSNSFGLPVGTRIIVGGTSTNIGTY